MQRLFAVAPLLTAVVLASAGHAAEPKPLFNGKTLEGWEGNKEMFRVQNGAIVGGTLQENIPHNEFLCTTREYGDFDLKAKFKLIGKGVNAGIQFRSKHIPNHHEVSGYQADLGEGWWGNLYDESRRNVSLAKPDPKEVDKVLRRDDWNDYRLLVQGKRIQLWINGLQTVDYTEKDKDIAERGIIGLQIHGGGPSEAWYKDITIEEK